jgi:hypothetical protein
MKTSFWGPRAWDFLFCAVAGAYPVRVDPTNRDHARTVRAFRAMLKSLQFTMPCFYCRQSFGAYLRDIPTPEQ